MLSKINQAPIITYYANRSQTTDFNQIENKYVLKLLKNDYFFLENSENTLN